MNAGREGRPGGQQEGGGEEGVSHVQKPACSEM